MLYKGITFPLFYEVGEGILENFRDIIKNKNLNLNNPLVICGKKTKKIAKKFFGEHPIIQLKSKDTDELIYLKENLDFSKVDSIIAIGGGSTIDFSKILGKLTLNPVVVIPTILSNDGISSPISIIRENNIYKKMGSILPSGIIVDLNLISSCTYTLAGLGDLISNISATYDWELANKKLKENIDYFSRDLAFMQAYKILSLRDNYNNIKDLLFLKDLAYGLIYSGLSMHIAKTSRPASGSEHNISHSLDLILKEKRKLHGIQVGFATLLTTYLQKQKKFHEGIIELFEKFKFPLNLKEIDIKKDVFLESLKIAPFIRKRYTILNEYSYETLTKILKNDLSWLIE